MKSVGWIIIYLIAGGLIFWTPSIIIHATRGYAFDGKDVGLITLLLPWVLLTFYALLRWIKGKQIGGPSMASFMLVGIWIFGSLATGISATFTEGGFALPGREAWFVIMLGLFPPYTFTMSTYDGSLGGLLLATALMILMRFKYERKNWVLPPRISRRFNPSL